MSDVRDCTNPLSKKAVRHIRSAKANVVAGMEIFEGLEEQEARLSPAAFEMLNETCLTLSSVLDAFDDREV